MFGNCLNLGGLTRTDDSVKNLQKLIPDGVVSRFDLDAPFESPPNRLDGCETLVEVKTLAALTMTPNARAQKFQSDVEKRVHDLDSKYPGSTFSQRLKSHGKDGRYLVLVVGPFANLLTISWFYATFSDVCAPSERSTGGKLIRSTRWQLTGIS